MNRFHTGFHQIEAFLQSGLDLLWKSILLLKKEASQVIDALGQKRQSIPHPLRRASVHTESSTS